MGFKFTIPDLRGKTPCEKPLVTVGDLRAGTVFILKNYDTVGEMPYHEEEVFKPVYIKVDKKELKNISISTPYRFCIILNLKIGTLRTIPRDQPAVVLDAVGEVSIRWPSTLLSSHSLKEKEEDAFMRRMKERGLKVD